MDKPIIVRMQQIFEGYAKTKVGIDFWFARDLQELLNHDDWINFLNVMEKAKISCKNSGHDAGDHFVDVTKTIVMSKGASKAIPDLILTRYACYLIAQSGDPRKEEIAFAQSFFAIQTRKQELIEQRIGFIERINAGQKLVASETGLSKLIYECGVDDSSFARIRSFGG